MGRPRRTGPLLAAGVVAALVLLAGEPPPVAVAVGEGAVWALLADNTLLRVDPGAHRVTGRLEPAGPLRPVPLPGTVYGLAAGEGAAWVLTGAADPGDRPDPTARLRRLDAASGAVTAVAELPGLVTGLATGPVVGGGAVWLVGPNADLRQGGSSLLRVDPAMAAVSGWLRSDLALANVLAAGPGGAWVATGQPELLHVVPA
jgi:hypothetical protein